MGMTGRDVLGACVGAHICAANAAVHVMRSLMLVFAHAVCVRMEHACVLLVLVLVFELACLCALMRHMY